MRIGGEVVVVVRRWVVRGWEFWRKAFWVRPGLLVVYGVGLGVVAMVFLVDVPGSVRDAVEMRGAPECAGAVPRAKAAMAPPQGCLERVEVFLVGPQYRRGPGSEWDLEVRSPAERQGDPRAIRRTVYAEADVPTAGSRRLQEGLRTDALFWSGEAVRIEVPGGDPVETDEWAHRGWLLELFIGLFALSGLAMLIESARLKRRTTTGWWSTRGEEGMHMAAALQLTPLMQVACLLAVPVLGILPLAFGLQVRWALLAAGIGLALVIFAIVKKHRGR